MFLKADAGAAVDLSGVVELTHLRHEQQFAGSVSLDSDTGEVVTISSGTGRLAEPEPEPLSVIIDRLNERYGTDWRDADRLVFDAALQDVVSDQRVQVQAVNNSPENFGLVFPQIFTDALLGRMDRNEKVVFRFLDDDELKSDVIKTYVTLAQAKAKIAYQEHCPIGELLGRRGERTPGVQVHPAHDGRHRRGVQAAGNRERQDGRGIREQHLTAAPC